MEEYSSEESSMDDEFSSDSDDEDDVMNSFHKNDHNINVEGDKSDCLSIF